MILSGCHYIDIPYSGMYTNTAAIFLARRFRFVIKPHSICVLSLQPQKLDVPLCQLTGSYLS